MSLAGKGQDKKGIKANVQNIVHYYEEFSVANLA